MRILQAKNLKGSGGINHGFFGRQGGVSTGIFASLNCGPGSGDVHASVIENRKRAAGALAAAALVSLYQIHSANAVTVTQAWDTGPQADAMATATPGIALGVLTADCAPVLLADAHAKVVGAAHAGWKGALGGVIDSVLEKMETLGADRARIAAAIGPCIAQANYEVGAEFRDAFRQSDLANAQFFTLSDRAGHLRFDLEGYVAHRLREAGVENVETLNADTYARESDFFSYRRATHRGEKDYGRQIAAIMLA
jgi:purine-nucleoside/S-methyl-5'-thioadenosine phosphorylase / adenosine deaminase